ncbi:MAG TPA: glutathione S-transferase N-terminal domain-containing protein [Candidatus Paceibacterota bacterium]|nr:glutathione S-transferase N-terminal domain-containing protein [Candidatus Paceibacterota bacterium]
MIKLYTWPTPNGYKVSIMLEELKLPYEIIPVHIGKGEQKKPSFLKLNPNHKIPVLVDGKTTIFESGAILIYLAEKNGALLPMKGPKRYETLEWLMFQMASVGPMFGQANHFRKYAPKKVPYAIERYDTEVVRIFGVLESKLKKSNYLAGSYSIADIATWPWVCIHKNMGIGLKRYPGVHRWLERVKRRPAVRHALAKVSDACAKS